MLRHRGPEVDGIELLETCLTNHKIGIIAVAVALFSRMRRGSLRWKLAGLHQLEYLASRLHSDCTVTAAEGLSDQKVFTCLYFTTATHQDVSTQLTRRTQIDGQIKSFSLSHGSSIFFLKTNTQFRSFETNGNKCPRMMV